MRRGFTLVELLIVIAVMGVLAGGAISIINPAAQIQKANDAKRKADLNQIEKAFEVYYQDNGKYPEVSDYKIVGTKTDGSIDALDWGYSGWQYMPTLPKDPSSSRNYVYCSSGQTYYLYASLETAGAGNISSTAGCPEASCGIAECNYGVSSPNVSP